MQRNQRIKKTVIAMALSLGLILTTAAPAQAASGTVGGTLNCTGSVVYYSTKRYISGSGSSGSNIQYRLSNAAGSKYGGWVTSLGAYIVKPNKYEGLKAMSTTQGPYQTLSATYRLPGTAFTLYGKMQPSNGACDNSFSGTLYW